MTLRVLSRPGRITQAGHIMTIVRNVAGTGAADEVGRIRLLQDKKTGQEVRRVLGFLWLGPLGRLRHGRAAAGGRRASLAVWPDAVSYGHQAKGADGSLEG